MAAVLRTSPGEPGVLVDDGLEIAAHSAYDEAVAQVGELWIALDGYAMTSAEAPEPELAQLKGIAAVAAAYRARGSALGDALAGNFALVLWDAPRRRLLLVRDQGGTRALFWSRRGEQLLFASELRGVLAGLPRTPAIEEVQLASHLGTVKIADLERTFYAGVSRVPAEHVLIAEQGGGRVERYSDVLDQPKLRGADWPALMRDRLGTAAARAVDGHRASLALSGGLDSNSLLAVLTGLRPAAAELPRLHAVTLAFRRFKRADESEWVDAVRAVAPIDHEYVLGDDLWPLHDYPDTLSVDEEPPPLFGMRSVESLFERAHAAGADVMLSGHGSDHLMLPSPLRLLMLFARPWSAARAELREYDRVFGARPSLQLRHAAQIVVSRHAPALLRLLPGLPDLRLLEQSYARSSGLVDAARRHLVERGAQAGRLRLLREATGQAALRLNEHVDRLGRANGMEWRLPFYDRDVMALVARVPADELHDGPYLKVILRRMLANVAPASVVDKARPTPHDELFVHGFGAGGAAALERLMRGSHLDRMGAVRDERFWDARRAMMAGGGGWVPAISSAVSAEIWLRRYLDGGLP